MRITLAQQAKPSGDVLFQNLGGEVVLLDLASERYFGLDPVGTRIWAMLDDGGTLEDIHRRLCDEYEAPSDQLRDDLLALVGQLAAAGLVTVD